MSLPFFYKADLTQEEDFQLDEANARHILTVLRKKEGDLFHLTDGRGQLITVKIVSVHKKNCSLRVMERVHIPARTKQVGIGISLVKNAARFEWFLEKATEIGVAEIIPLICHRTEKFHFRFERMQQILISAMLQSQQTWLPQLRLPTDLMALLADNKYQNKWIAHCLPDARVSLRGNNLKGESEIILIGPEGDFTDAEITAAIAAGYTAVELGGTRLRTETAGMVGAALLLV